MTYTLCRTFTEFKNLALRVPDDDDDVITRGGLRQFVGVLA
jgi:hypothetical protein